MEQDEPLGQNEIVGQDEPMEQDETVRQDETVGQDKAVRWFFFRRYALLEVCSLGGTLFRRCAL